MEGGVRKIIHIDMDAFYASVEQRDFPELKGKPVIVGGDPFSRGVVAAASYEARAFGVRSAMPTRTAHRLCPDGAFQKPRFEVYRRVSRHIMSLMREITPLVEPLSLDEAYLDVSAIAIGKRYASSIAKEVREKIFSQTGLTASAGIASNKFLAKIASDENKPNGQSVIRPREVEEFLKELPIRKVPGIGKVMEEKMHRLGILVVSDLLRFSKEELESKFGKQSAWFYAIARGIDNREVKPHRERKSISCEDTFSKDLIELHELHNEIERLAEELERRMTKKELGGHTFTLKVTYADFEKITRSTTSKIVLSEARQFSNLGKQLLDETEAGTRPIRLIGIGISNFEKGAQLSLKL